jgi:hypothetical protein
MSRKLWPLAALATVALIGAGCSNDSADTGTGTGTGTASSSGSGSSAGTGGNKKATDRDKAVKFAECVRENGVSDFPDPNAKGDFEYGVSVSPAVWKKAIDACKELQPPGTLSAKRSPKQQSAGLKFAQCIRENGVKDFPDPVNGEPLVDTNRIPSGRAQDEHSGWASDHERDPARVLEHVLLDEPGLLRQRLQRGQDLTLGYPQPPTALERVRERGDGLGR